MITVTFKKNTKKVVQEIFSNYWSPTLKVLSVRKGRGSASSWLTITTDAPVADWLRGFVSALLVRDGLCGTYYTDYGGGVDCYAVCVQWEVKS